VLNYIASQVNLRWNTQPERDMSATSISTQVARGLIPLGRAIEDGGANYWEETPCAVEEV